MFCRLSDRFGWTPEEISELNSFQLEYYFEWLLENPFPIGIHIDPPKRMPQKRGRRR
jgi:hypothetical protein